VIPHFIYSYFVVYVFLTKPRRRWGGYVASMGEETHSCFWWENLKERK
jgi:hypothetical protein